MREHSTEGDFSEQAVENEKPKEPHVRADSDEAIQLTRPRTNSETRRIVTPYAFTVSPDLLGEPLATPKRRGIAILIDLFLITVLSTLSAFIFAAFVALTFFKAGNQVSQKGAWAYTKLVLRGTAALIVFVIAFSAVQDISETGGNTETSSSQLKVGTSGAELDLTQLFEIGEFIAVSRCEGELSCVVERLEPMLVILLENETIRAEVETTIDDLVESGDLSESDAVQANVLLMQKYDQLRGEKTFEEPAITVADKPKDIAADVIKTNEQKPKSGYKNLLDWLDGMMQDLGLGLGWAALYFSVFTAWWNGQTIGKRMMRIKVVRLDGKTPTLWESFGRYGGYGAGFATGLSGFLQLYWDPNRQAIQDKISETLVLRVRRAGQQKESLPELLADNNPTKPL